MTTQKVRVTEYEPTTGNYINEFPTVKIKTWELEIPVLRHTDGYISTFKAADYVGRLYLGKTLGVTIL